MRRKDQNPARGGFTLIELLVVIAILSVLASLLLPTLKQAQNKAQLVVCVNNLHQIGIAALGYAGDNDGRVPPMDPDPSPYRDSGSFINAYEDIPRGLGLLIPDYLADDRVFRCPRDEPLDRLHPYQPGQPLSVNYKTSYAYIGGFTRDSLPRWINVGSRMRVADEPHWGPICAETSIFFHDYKLNALTIAGQVVTTTIPRDIPNIFNYDERLILLYMENYLAQR
jgi:prepilin-type N-terminal cleavage/methylation domain-containing protein